MTSTGEAGVLIVGACQAGVQLACSLREYGYTAPVTLVGGESHAPYQRPPLSKALLAGEVGPESLVLRTDAFYAEQGIDVVLGEEIVRIDRREPAGSGVAVAASGRTFPFDRLALTVGAGPRPLRVPGADLDGVVYLRDADDAARLRQRLADASKVLVVGGGFIGLEVAATARKLGRDVTVALLDDRLMARAVGAPTSAAFLAAHSARGVHVDLGVQPIRVLDDGTGRANGVELVDGRLLVADLVVVGIGVVPRTRLAEQLGLAVDDGIVVDEHGVTSDGMTVAAGDCVRGPAPVDVPGATRLLRFESVNTAAEQARTAAATLTGLPRPYRALPWFWSDQYDLKLQVAGLIDGHDHHVVRGDPDSEKFGVLYYAGERLVAGEFVNRPVDFMAVRSALNGGRTIPADRAADVSEPLKNLVVDLCRTDAA